ncbi:MAG: MFS transporter [Anaerolineae bacterium]
MGHKNSYPPSFYLAILANLFFFASFQWTYVTLPAYIQKLGGGATEIGLAVSLATLSAVVGRPAIGRLVDRWGRKRWLLIGATLFALEPALYVLIPSVWPLLGVRLLRGIGIAAFTTAYTTLVADMAPVDRRGEAVGMSGITNNLGMLFAPAVGAYVQVEWGYPFHFWASASMALISLAILLPIREPERQAVPDGQNDHPRSSFRSVIQIRAIQATAFGSTGLAVVYGATLSFLPPFAAENRLGAAGGYFTAFAVAMMAAQAAAGWLSDRLGRRAVAIPGMLGAAMATAGLTMVHRNVALLASGAGLGLSWGLVRAGLDTSVIDIALPEERGTALGVLYTCFDAGIGLGSFGLGIVAQAKGYTTAFHAAALWAGIALIGYLVWSQGRS